jgi:UDP-N-acetylglucosamine acyltransferase
MLGGGSAVAQDIPPFCTAEGNRAILRGLNLNGLRRKFGDNKQEIDLLKKAYNELFKSNAPLQEVASRILETSDSKNVKYMAQFIKNTKRGIPFERN